MPRTTTEPINEAKWEAMYQQLVEYHTLYDHTRVPQTHGELGKWVKLQRKKYKQQKMPTERIEKLNAIGFLWNAQLVGGGVGVGSGVIIGGGGGDGTIENGAALPPPTVVNLRHHPSSGTAAAAAAANKYNPASLPVIGTANMTAAYQKEALWNDKYQQLRRIAVEEVRKKGQLELEHDDQPTAAAAKTEAEATSMDEDRNDDGDDLMNEHDFERPARKTSLFSNSSTSNVPYDFGTLYYVFHTIKEEQPSLYKWLGEQRKKYNPSGNLNRLSLRCITALNSSLGTLWQVEPSWWKFYFHLTSYVTQFGTVQPLCCLETDGSNGNNNSNKKKKVVAKRHLPLEQWVHEQRLFENLVNCKSGMALPSSPTLNGAAMARKALPMASKTTPASSSNNTNNSTNTKTAPASNSPTAPSSASTLEASSLTLEQAEWLQALPGWTWEGDDNDNDQFGKYFLQLKRMQLDQQGRIGSAVNKDPAAFTAPLLLKINVRKAGPLGKFVQTQRQLYKDHLLSSHQSSQAAGSTNTTTKPTIESLAAAAETLEHVKTTARADAKRKANAETETGPASKNQKAMDGTAVATTEEIATTVDGAMKKTSGRKKSSGQVMDQRRIDALDSIGFSWTATNVQHTWDDMFQQLIEYKQAYGDCLVPKRFKRNPKLGMWVGKQRDRYKKMQQLLHPEEHSNADKQHKKYWDAIAPMSQEQLEKLQSIGMVWTAGGPDVIKSDWQAMFEKLKRYQERYGHCNVSQKASGELGRLGRWVKTQREKYHGTKVNLMPLTADQKAQLEAIGFEWRPGGTSSNEEMWMFMFNQLRDFREEHGDCKVPQKKGKLGGWVDRQRKRYRATIQAREFWSMPENIGQKAPSLRHNTEMSDGQIELLNSIGFVWNLRERPKRPILEHHNMGHEYAQQQQLHPGGVVPDDEAATRSLLYFQGGRGLADSAGHGFGGSQPQQGVAGVSYADYVHPSYPTHHDYNGSNNNGIENMAVRGYHSTASTEGYDDGGSYHV